MRAGAVAFACSGSPGPSTSNGPEAGADGEVSSDGATQVDSASSSDSATAPDASGGASIQCMSQTGMLGCGCTVSSPGNDAPCGPAQVTGTAQCCADDAWPAAGSYCGCTPFSCSEVNGEMCECTSLFSGTMTSCSGQICCATTADPDGIGACSCYTAQECGSNETQVATCTVMTTPCDVGQRLVTGCR